MPGPNEVTTLLQNLNQYTPSSPSNTPSHVTITGDQLSSVIHLLQHQQCVNNSSLAQPPPVPPPVHQLDFAIAKYEDIITKPIKPKFDGFTDSRVPMLNRLVTWT